MCSRNGRQVAPASFTKYLLESHARWRYPLIRPHGFALPVDFEERVKMLVKKLNNNRAVGTDVVHV